MYAYAGDKRTTAVPLTPQVVERLRGDGTDRWVKDGQLRCLYVRVRPNGEKTFALRVKREGKVAVITLGAWGPHPPQLSLKEARLEAARRLGSPMAKSRTTVEDALKDFWEGHIEREWKDQRNASVYRRAIEAALGRRVLAEVAKADVASMVRRYRTNNDGDTRLVARNRRMGATGARRSMP